MNCPKCAAPLDTREVGEDISAEACFNCYGVFYDMGEIAVPVELTGARPTAFACPKDGSLMTEGTLGRDLALERCPTCGGLWFDSGEIQKLRQISGVENVVGPPGSAPPPEAAQPGKAKGKPPIFIPPIPVPGNSSVRPAQPKTAGPARPASPVQPGAAKPRLPRPRSVEPVESNEQHNPDQRQNPLMLYEGREYKHFQTSFPTVSYVVGEFNWKAAVGDSGKARDFICPPYMLSEDVSDSDALWSHGEYLEPAEVWEGFSLKGNPPLRRDVAPPQLNPHAESRKTVGRWCRIYLAAAAALFIGMSAVAQKKVVFQKEFHHTPVPGEASFVTEPFLLEGHPSTVEVRTTTGLNNEWLFLRLALINADTDTAINFDREISYYHGVDGGESWSEGGQNDTVFLPKVPAGTYYLRIEPESPGSVHYAIRVTRDVPRFLHLFLALMALVFPVAWVWWRHFIIEKQRWAESDHPLVETEE